MNKMLKRYVILAVGIICFTYPIKTLNGCGGYDPIYPHDDLHYLINQDIVSAPEYEPFYFDIASKLYPYSDSLFYGYENNINEWYTYFKRKISKEDIYNLVYGYDKLVLDSIKNYSKNKKISYVPKKVLSYFKNKKRAEALDYLMLVRDLQPIVAERDGWRGDVHDTALVTRLFMQGEELFKKSKSDFIKMRIGYQLSRIAHYTGSFEKSITYYDQYVLPFSSQSIIQYMTLAHKAASLKALNKTAEATYLYSIVFANCIERRLRAFRSALYEGESFNEALELCKNDEERVTLYFLNALEHVNPYPEGLNNVYSLKPDSKEMELLIMREMKKTEVRYTVSDYDLYEDEESTFTQQDLRDFIVSGIEKGKVRNIALWNFFVGYIDFLEHDYVSALDYFNKVKSDKAADIKLRNQVRIIETIIKIDQKDRIDKEFEATILKEIKWLHSLTSGRFEEKYEYKNARNYFLERLSSKYASQGEIMMAEICANVYTPIDLYHKTEEEKINVLWDFLHKKDKSELELYLGEKISYSIEQLNEMKGMMALRKADFKSATQFFINAGSISDDEKSYGDPFEFKINNCMECDEEDDVTYTRREFAQKMMEYESLARKDKRKQAEYYFMIGLGLFNISYYGTSYNLADYYRSFSAGGNSEDVLYKLKGSDGLPDDAAIKEYYANLRGTGTFYENYDCTIAMEYFRKTMSLTKDKELAAKACYMAAKCEESNRYQGIVDIDKGLGKHKFYKILKDKYSESRFYEEVINECSYFNNYVNNPI
jgi:hypothetical protein